ncbi:MAG: transposase [Deltaproteobacteria bacterium]|nr:transposase [Deltaproteobacteria bacterium]
MRQKGFTKRMYPRNGIEGTLSELVRGHGLRRTKYRGINRVRLSHYMMGAACNIKRYPRFTIKKSKIIEYVKTSLACTLRCIRMFLRK